MKKNIRTVLILISIIFACIIFAAIFKISKNSAQFPNETLNIEQNNQKAINIVFSTDKNYKNYLKVAILSAILNKNSESFYNIYVLGVDLSKKDIEEIEALAGFENLALAEKKREKGEEKRFLGNKNEDKKSDGKIKITVLPLKSKMLDKKLKRKLNLHYVSRADFFKIFLPEIFKNFDKILYLDSDILVLGDLGDLFNTNLEDKYLGAVKRFDSSPKLKEDFYNCGVMLYNLEKWRQNNISDKIAQIKNNNKKNTTLTQYPFNKIIKKKDIILLPPVFNNIVWDERDFDIEKYKKNYSPLADSIKNYKDLSEKTIIAHFAGIKKPWHNPNIEFGEKWWQCARIINPNWKKEKRNLIKYIFNCFAITTKFTQNKNLSDFFKNFYQIFKYNY